MAESMRLRILIGMVVMIAGLAIWALVVMRVGPELVPSWWLPQLLFYAVCGSVWIYPAALLTAWMQRPGGKE